RPKVLVAGTQRSRLEVILETEADLLGATQPEPLLERAVVVGAPRPEHAPEPESKVIHGALEVRDHLPRYLALGHSGLDGPQDGVERRDLIAKGRLRHRSLPRDG